MAIVSKMCKVSQGSQFPAMLAIVCIKTSKHSTINHNNWCAYVCVERFASAPYPCMSIHVCLQLAASLKLQVL